MRGLHFIRNTPCAAIAASVLHPPVESASHSAACVTSRDVWSAFSYTWSMRQLALGIRNMDSTEASLEMTVSRHERRGLDEQQRLLLVGMLASRMTIADFEEASHASYSTGAFTVNSIASWKAGTPLWDAQTHRVTCAPSAAPAWFGDRPGDSAPEPVSAQLRSHEETTSTRRRVPLSARRDRVGNLSIRSPSQSSD